MSVNTFFQLKFSSLSLHYSHSETPSMTVYMYHKTQKVERDKKAFSRIRTARLETTHVSVSAATTRCHIPQMNKFEQVSSDQHQMSEADRVRAVLGLMSESWGIPCLISRDQMHHG